MASRDNYQITGNTIDEVVRNLNFLMQRIADRLDKMEGIRGAPSMESDLSVQGSIEVSDDEDNVIHSME